MNGFTKNLVPVFVLVAIVFSAIVFSAIVFCTIVFVWRIEAWRIDTHIPDEQQFPSQPLNQLREQACWFAVPENLAIDCGYYFVADQSNFDNSQPGSSFNLPYVRIRDQSSDHQSDPLIYLPGGPGGSNSLEEQNIAYWIDWINRANLSRDVVLVDQRGTGLSHPQYRCQGYENYLREVLKQNINQQQELDALTNALSTCIEEFQQRGFLFSQISTTQSVSDLQELMQSLGYSQWNVMGASYGTRVAMTWSRQSPERLRAMILDSVYPPGKGGLLHWPETLEKSFRVAWDTCQSSDDCQFTEQQLSKALSALKAKPISVSISLWEGGWPMDVVVTDHRFLFAAYSSLYRPSSLQKLSSAIDGLLAGNNDGVQQLLEASINSDLDPTFNPFTYFVVECAENYRPLQTEYDSARAQYSLFQDYTRQSVTDDVCQLFPQSSDSLSANDITNYETPTLFLAGALDPVTPARWVEDIKDQYLNGQVWKMPGLSHGVSANSDCILSSLRQFLDQPNRLINNVCLERE